MSTIDLPRLYFKGETSWDPSLSNNMAPLFDGGAVSLGPEVDANRPDSERKRLPVVDASMGGWNHFGTHDAEFLNVTITGTSLRPGHYDSEDPIVGKVVGMRGKLVDFDPRVTYGTQIFFDKIEVGDVLAGITALRSKRMYVRFLNFSRSAAGLPIAGNAGGMAEVALPKQGLEFQNFSRSMALTTLEEAMTTESIRGILIRFHIYRTLYFRNGISNTIPQKPRNSEELAQLYANGDNFSNPAVSHLVGTLMPWRTDEFEGYPKGRILFPVAGSQAPKLGNVIVEFDKDKKSLVLDLGQTIPEATVELEKVALGPISLKSRHNGNEKTLVVLNPQDYDKASYERTSGLIDIALPNTMTTEDLESVESGDLILEVDGRDALAEPAFITVIEDRDIYLDAGETRDIRIAVTSKGVLVNQNIRVYPILFGEPDGPTVQKPLLVDTNGYVVFTVPANSGTVRTYVFIAVGDDADVPEAPAVISSQLDNYLNIRYLPDDDELEANTPDSELSWPFIYNSIFKVFDVTNPIMSRKANPTINIPLHDRQSMESRAQRIKEVIDPAAIEDFKYMPVTRDLSRGKRKLLTRWCNLVLRGRAPLPSVPQAIIPIEIGDDPRIEKQAALKLND